MSTATDFAVRPVNEDDAPPPSVQLGNLELADGGRVFRVWRYRSRHALQAVMQPDYWDPAVEHGIKLHDRIQICANDRSPDGAEYADLVVSTSWKHPSTGSHIKVRLL